MILVDIGRGSIQRNPVQAIVPRRAQGWWLLPLPLHHPAITIHTHNKMPCTHGDFAIQTTADTDKNSPCSKSPVTPSSVTVCKPSPRSLISVK